MPPGHKRPIRGHLVPPYLAPFQTMTDRRLLVVRRIVLVQRVDGEAVDGAPHIGAGPL